VDTFASFRDTVYTKSEKFPAFANYTARLLDKDGKPTERKHIALTTGAAASQPETITTHANGKTATFPATATAAQAVEAMKAAGINNVSVGDAAAPPKDEVQAALNAFVKEFNKHTNNVAPPASRMPPSTREKIADALRRQTEPGSSYAAAKKHSDIVAAERLTQAATKEQWRDFPTVEDVRATPFTVWAIQRPDGSVFYGYFVITVTSPTEQHIYLQQCTEAGITLQGAISQPFSCLRELKAHSVETTATHIKCGTYVSIPGQDSTELGEVVATKRTTVGDPSCDIRFGLKTVSASLRDLKLEHRNFAERVAATVERYAAEAAAKEALTSTTTSATIPKQGATMPSTDTAKPSRMRRAITEATRRAPVELGLNQAHEAIVKQAAKKFKGTRAEKAVVARFLSDLLGSEYGKAGLAAALATVIPQLAPLLGKHEGKAETLAEELATRSATILAVKAGSDLISLLGPLTAILSDMISSAETPQITAGTGRSALDEIGDVATTTVR